MGANPFAALVPGNPDYSRHEENRAVFEVLGAWDMKYYIDKARDSDGLCSFERLEKAVDMPVLFRVGRPRGSDKQMTLANVLRSFDKSNLMKLYLSEFDDEIRADTTCALLFGGTVDGSGLVMHNSGLSSARGYKTAGLVVSSRDDLTEQFVIERRRVFYAAHKPD